MLYSLGDLFLLVISLSRPGCKESSLFTLKVGVRANALGSRFK